MVDNWGENIPNERACLCLFYSPSHFSTPVKYISVFINTYMWWVVRKRELYDVREISLISHNYRLLRTVIISIIRTAAWWGLDRPLCGLSTSNIHGMMMR